MSVRTVIFAILFLLYVYSMSMAAIEIITRLDMKIEMRARWMTGVLTFPYAGSLVYYMLGEREKAVYPTST